MFEAKGHCLKKRLDFNPSTPVELETWLPFAGMPQADLQFPSRGVLRFWKTLLCGSEPDPLACCLAVLLALKTRTFQKAEINVG